jgi:MFS family permease
VPRLPTTPAPRFFYGWVVVWAAHVVLALIFAATYSFGTFFPSFQEAFNANRASVAFAFSASVCVYFVFGIIAGLVADRTHVRVTAIGGVLLTAAGFWWASRATSLVELYAALLVGIGLGVGAVYVPTIGAVQPWFVKRRAFAAGLASAGIGLGTLVGPLFAAWAIKAMGFRAALEWMAGIVLVFGLLAAVWLEKSPARMGLAPDNEPAQQHANLATSGMGFKEGLLSKPFRMLFVAQFACSLTLFVPMAHLPRHALDRGFSVEQGAWLIGLIGLGSFSGRFFLTGLGDKFGKRALVIGCYALLATAFAWWALSLALPASFIGLGVFALLYGLSYGGLVGVSPPLMMDYVGGKNLSSLIGALYAGAGIGTLFAPTFAGWMYDQSGSYLVPLLLGVVGNAMSVWLSLKLPDPKGGRLERAI